MGKIFNSKQPKNPKQAKVRKPGKIATKIQSLPAWVRFLLPTKGVLVWFLLFGLPFFAAIPVYYSVLDRYHESMPSPNELNRIDARLVTKIYDKDMNVIHEFFTEKRTWVPFEKIPKVVIQSLMASEDRDFYDHWGINAWQIPKAVIQSYLKGRRLRGASTLSQQLAKNLYVGDERSIERKIKEALTAIELEKTYTKEEILEFYLNIVFLGGNNYGYPQACKYYFGIPLDSISASQAAVLTAMLPSPTNRRPDRHPRNSNKWRKVVLGAMHEEGFLNASEYKKALNDQVIVVAHEEKDALGGYFVEEVRKYMEKKYGEESLYKDGNRVYTTLDAELQKVAEQAMLKHLETLEPKFRKKHTYRLKLHKVFDLPVDTVIAHFDSLYTIFDSVHVKPDKHKQYLARKKYNKCVREVVKENKSKLDSGRLARKFNGRLAWLEKNSMDKINKDSLFKAVRDTMSKASERQRKVCKRKEGHDYKRKYPDEDLYDEIQGALVVIENETGAVRAMVGGKNFEESRFNRAIQSSRSVGSSFKPFVYSLAMDNGANPADTVTDGPIVLKDPNDPEKDWRPDNYGHKFEGTMSMRRALYLSKNAPAIEVANRYGLHNVVQYAKKFGLGQTLGRDLYAVPAMALGSEPATLMEMVSAYTTYPNGGKRLEPYFINRIVGNRGAELERNVKTEHVVLRPASAYLVLTMLKDVNTRGTAAKVWARGFHHPSGGKTGTTNDYTDAWYVGFTRDYTMGVWVGRDDSRPMDKVYPSVTGGDGALPIWIETMKWLHKDLKKKGFAKPGGICMATVCKGTGKLAGKFCPEPIGEVFHCSTVPTEVYDGSTEVKDDAVTDQFSGRGMVSDDDGSVQNF